MNYINEGSFFDYLGIDKISNDEHIFPSGEGWQTALRALANFPKNTELFEYRNIGAIMSFFTNINPKGYRGNFDDEKIYRVAIFIEDLISLHNLGYIKGLKPISQLKFDLNNFNELLDNGFTADENGNALAAIKLPDGSFKIATINKPNIKEKILDYFGIEYIEDYTLEELNELFEEFDASNQDFIEIEDKICISELGWETLLNINKQFIIPEEIQNIINPLLSIKYYSTSVREISIYLENELKLFHGIKTFGDKLIETHIKECVKFNNGNFNAGIKVYKQELRTMNKFIRNEFIHNIFEISYENYISILYRQCELYNLMKHAFLRLKKQSNSANN